jgi:hypothetical protein
VKSIRVRFSISAITAQCSDRRTIKVSTSHRALENCPTEHDKAQYVAEKFKRDLGWDKAGEYRLVGGSFDGDYFFVLVHKGETSQLNPKPPVKGEQQVRNNGNLTAKVQTFDGTCWMEGTVTNDPVVIQSELDAQADRIQGE